MGTTSVIILLGFALLLACGASALAAWYARGQREARSQRDAAMVVQKATQVAQAAAQFTKDAVAKQQAELAAGDHLDDLLEEKVPE